MSEKPGCLHPGDPQGWCGTDLIVFVVTLAAAAYWLFRKHTLR